MDATPEQIEAYSRMALERGGRVGGGQPEPPGKRKKRARPKLLPPLWVLEDFRILRMVVPVAVRSEANGRDWRARSNRSDQAFKAIGKLLGANLVELAIFGAHYHYGKPLAIRFVRLGGKRMDHSNLPAALKSCEDALAHHLGADDGDPRWIASWAQETAEGEGVRIEIATVEYV